MWIDAHAHLSSFSSVELKKILEKANIENVSYILNTSTNLTDAMIVIEQCKDNKELFGAVGISPFDSIDLPLFWEEKLIELSKNSKIIGIGEIGLDASNPAYPPIDVQKRIFEKQLEISITCGIPVIIHSRGAERIAFEMCKINGVGEALFHCFTGSKTDAKIIADTGYYISFSGIVTFRNSKLEEVVKSVPLERILIETDTPYLAPEPYRGQKNRPQWVRYVGEKIAKIFCLDYNLFEENIENNFKNLFKRFKPFPINS